MGGIDTDSPTLRPGRRAPLLATTWTVAALFLWVGLVDATHSGKYAIDSELVRRAVGDFVGHRPVDLPYVPSAYFVLAPMRLLSRAVSEPAFLLLTAAALAFSVCATGRLLGRGWFGLPSAVGVVVVAWSLPARDALVVDNLGLLVQAALVGVLLLGTGGRWRWATVVFALACCVKPHIAPAGLVLLLDRRWREAAAVVGTFVGLNLLALLLLVDRGDYLHHALGFVAAGKGASHYNLALLSSMRGLGLPAEVVLGLRVLVVAAAAYAVLLLAPRPVGPRRLVLLTTLPVVALMLAGGLAEDHYSLVTVPLVAMALLEGSRAAGVVAAAGVWLLGYAGPTPLPGVPKDRMGLGLLVVFAAGLLLVRQERRPVGTTTGPAAAPEADHAMPAVV